MVDFAKAHDRIKTSLSCDKMRETEVPGLPGQVTALVNFMGKNTSACACYGGQLSDEWNVKTGVRQGGISSGM